MDEATDKELHNAIQSAISDPNLSSYMYIKNFDYLVDQGGYIDKQVKVVQGNKRQGDSRKLHAMHRVDIEDRIKLSTRKDDKKIDGGEVGKGIYRRKVKIKQAKAESSGRKETRMTS